MELKETIDMMTSDDYSERFVGEYWQLKIRRDKLKHFCDRIIVSQMEGCRIEAPKHDCPDELLLRQLRVMDQYIDILEMRAVVEGIELEVM